MRLKQTRRRFLAGLSLASAGGLVRVPRPLAGEPPLETTTVRFQKPGLCVSSLYIAEELLRAEGFTDIRYLQEPEFGGIGLIRGEVDFCPGLCLAGRQGD